MKKLKKLWNNNRVMFVLGIIVVICVIIILFVMVQYFFGTSKSNYGDRLDDIVTVPFHDEQKDALKKSLTTEHTTDVSVDVKGKIVYIIARFDASVSLDDAKKLASESVLHLEEQYRNLYDFNVTLVQDVTDINTGYTMMGAKNASSEIFAWSNNTPLKDGE